MTCNFYIKTFRYIVIFSQILFSVKALAQMPVAPKISIEIFGITKRSHVIDASCGAGSARLEWKFDGKVAKFSNIVFDHKSVSSPEIKMLNDSALKIGGDIFVYVECDSSAAIVSLIQSQLAGTSQAKQARFNIVDGRVRFIRNYNF